MAGRSRNEDAKRIDQKRREQLFEQGVQKAIVTLVLLAIGVVLHLLVLGLFSKNKTVRLVTLVILICGIVGGIIYFYGDDISANFKNAYCRYCGIAGFSAKTLAKEPCPRHPKGPNEGNHEAYPDGPQDAYYCALCGEKFGSLQKLLADYCPRSAPAYGKTHVPYIRPSGYKWFKCCYCGRGFTHIKEMVSEHCPKNPNGSNGYHQGATEPDGSADSTPSSPASTISGQTHITRETNTIQAAGIPVQPSVTPAVQQHAQTASTPSLANHHFAEAEVHNWNRIFREEWPQSFIGFQKVFFAFGGFVLAQPPIAGSPFDEDCQRNVPLKKTYRYFQQADLEFFHGALIGFTLHVHFAPTYSQASVEREALALTEDVSAKLKTLVRPDLGLRLEEYPGGSEWPGQWTKKWNISFSNAQNRSGYAYMKFILEQTDDGYEMKLSVETRNLTHFIDDMLQEEAYEMGDELPPL